MSKTPILLSLLLVSGLVSSWAWGDDAAPAPEQKLKAIEQQLDQSQAQQKDYAGQADTLAVELATLRADSVDAAEKAQAHEAALTDLEGQLASLTTDEAHKQADLRRQREREAQLLSALGRLALDPPEALALGQDAPDDQIRTGILMGATVPHLEAEAQTLRTRLAELRRLDNEIHQKQQATLTEKQGLEQQQAEIQTLIDRKSALHAQALKGAEESAQTLTALSVEANDLHDLIERLDAERQKAEQQVAVVAIPKAELDLRETVPDQAAAPAEIDPSRPSTIRPFDKARGAMVYPASGTVIDRYGELNEFGVSSKGLTLVTRPGAVVVAPFDGQIEFAGPFKGYGQILIIQHGDGYHSLLAGLDRIDGMVGDWLVAGEPVGAMASGNSRPRLYLELRHNGQPINPLPWLATHDEKVSG